MGTMAGFAFGGASFLEEGTLQIVAAVIYFGGCFVVLVAVGMLFFAATSILPAIVVLEDVSFMTAIRRCWSLVMAARLRAIGLGFTVYMIVVLPTSGLQFFIGAIPVLGGLIWGLAQAIGYAYMATTWVVYYFDVRCRFEAFDIEYLAQLVEADAPGSEIATY